MNDWQMAMLMLAAAAVIGGLSGGVASFVLNRWLSGGLL